MVVSAIEEYIEFLFMHGVVAGIGRLVLLALCVVGASSVYWGSPLGPVGGLVLAGIMLYVLGHRPLTGVLLQPDVEVWEQPAGFSQIEIWIRTVIATGLFCLLAIGLLYNTPLHGVWMLPLPTAVMALQRLADRRRRKEQPHPAGPPATSMQHQPGVSSGEGVV